METFSKPNKDKEFEERVVEVNRISRTVAGGRRIRFRAAVVIGNRKGRVGMGVAKSNEVVDAVNKAVRKAKAKLINVALQEGTIPYQTQIRYGGAVIFLKPAAPGTGLIAGGVVRAVAELSGITDILSKSLGSENKINCLKATMIALEALKARKTKPAEPKPDKTSEDSKKIATLPPKGKEKKIKTLAQSKTEPKKKLTKK